jgi:hypothetical protein
VADWATIASVATAGGTLVLAIATFASTRTANRAAQVAERSLRIGLRPVLVPARDGDPAEEVQWGDDHKIVLGGGVAWVEVVGENVYLAMSLRNVGPGLGVLRGWRVQPELIRSIGALQRPDPEEFTNQLRDLYVPAGDASYWQASLRPNDDMLESDEDLRVALSAALERADGITIDLLYTDGEGDQPTISRFAVRGREGGSGEPAAHVPTVIRHWRL